MCFRKCSQALLCLQYASKIDMRIMRSLKDGILAKCDCLSITRRISRPEVLLKVC